MKYSTYPRHLIVEKWEKRKYIFCFREKVNPVNDIYDHHLEEDYECDFGDDFLWW